MKVKVKTVLLFAGVCAATLGVWGAGPFYVDGTNGSEAYDGLARVYDGTHGPKKLIQSAVELVPHGESGTVYVLPGVYGDDQGYVCASNKVSAECWDDGKTRCRVFIADACVRLESTEGSEKTHIVGKRGTSSDGLGDDAVRCIGVGCGSGSAGSVVKGFTLRGGASRTNDKTQSRFGGALCSDLESWNVYLVDSVVSNCVADIGGALCGVTAIRSRLSDNSCVLVNWGMAALRCNAYACIFMNNGPRKKSLQEALVNFKHVMNCTFVANPGGSLRLGENWPSPGKIINCVFSFDELDYSVRNQSTSMMTVDHCITDLGLDRILSSTDATKKTVSNTESVTDFPYVLASPFEHDFRVVKGGKCDGTGDPAACAAPDWVPTEFQGFDFYGQPLVVGGKAPIGAVAEAVAMKGGFLRIDSNTDRSVETMNTAVDVKVSLVDRTPYYYLGAVEAWPRQVRLRGRVSDPATVGEPLYFSATMVNASGSHFRFVNANCEAAFTLPPTNVAQTVTLNTATNILYAAPGGLKSNTGRSADSPWPLQYACDQAKPRTLVKALPGTYATDETLACGLTNRVWIHSAYTLVRATAGASETVIRGNVPRDASGNWIFADNAVRCVCLDVTTAGNTPMGLQGFTLTDGAVTKNENSASGSAGGAYCPKINSCYANLLDCVVTNCYGSRGAGIRNVWAQRCKFTDCTGSGAAVIREAHISSCILEKNHLPNGLVLQTSCNAWNCSFYEPSLTPQGTPVIIDASSGVWNSISVGGAGFWTASTPAEYAGNYLYGTNSPFNLPPTGCTRVTTEGLLFADEANGDYRPLSDSPAVYGGATPDSINNCAVGLGGSVPLADWARFTVDGYDGALMTFRDGRGTSGAIQKPAQVVNVVATHTGDIAPAGRQVVGVDGTLQVEATGDEHRNHLGFDVDGEFRPSASRTYVFEQGDAPPDVVALSAVYATNWYVNAGADYLDTNDGWTPETAKHSLKEAVRYAVSGDFVHLAKGTYDEETCLHEKALLGGTVNIRSRVFVPAGVTLFGDEGPDGVIIKGKKATNAAGGDYDANTGNGSDAIRCVTLDKNAKVMNVTLTDGHTGLSGSKVTSGDNGCDDNFGGSVLGASRNYCYVENCIITNCTGGRSAGVGEALAINCFISDNNSGGGAYGRRANFVGCVLVGGKGAQPLLEIGYIVDSTVVVSNCAPAISSVGYFANSVIVSDRDVLFGDAACALSNCVLNAEVAIENDKVTSNNLVRIALKDLKLDCKTGLLQKDSPLVDWPSRFATGADQHCRAYDYYGVPRVLNGGKQDLGACEYDWRTDYAHDLRAGSVTVTEVSPLAQERSDRRVWLPSGSLAFDWAPGDLRIPVAEVTGNGTLALYRDDSDTPVHTWTQGSRARYRLKDDLSVAAKYRFVYTPGADDAGGAILGPFGDRPGLVIMLN